MLERIVSTPLPLMKLRERFAHQPLVPTALARQQSTWRQRWGLPPRQPHVQASDWAYRIDPAAIIGKTDPADPSLRLIHALGEDGGVGAKYFLTGSKGAGKSTTVYSLYEHPRVTDNFHVIACSITDYLNPAVLDAGQVLAVMAALVVEAILDVERDAALGIVEAKNLLAEQRRLFKELIPKARLESASVNVFGLISAQFGESESVRDQFRGFLDGRYDEFMGVFDRFVTMLERYRQKKLLIVIDDLDKIGTRAIHTNVFNEQLDRLLRPNCAALYTFPLELHHDARFERLKSQPNRCLLGNVKLFAAPDKLDLLDEGRAILDVFLARRLDSGRLDGVALETYFDTADLARVYRYSCGNYRELCRIVQHALQTAAMVDKTRVDAECWRVAIDQLRTDYNPYLQRNRATLHAVRDNLSADEPHDLDAAVLAPLIQALAVVEYPDNPGWLGVHPVLEDLMDGQPTVI